jgi:signal transduction histidine kinase
VRAAELLEQCVSTIRVVADGKGVTLDARCYPADAIIAVDRARMRQVLYNLLSNAIKQTPEGGLVTISTQLDQEEAVMAVKDTGVGVKPEELVRIFEEFHQADSPDGRVREGTGLGLSVVRKLVELHGGTVTVESAPGQGSCFEVRLPQAHLASEAPSVGVASEAGLWLVSTKSGGAAK